jgi:hypothetical protein
MEIACKAMITLICSEYTFHLGCVKISCMAAWNDTFFPLPKDSWNSSTNLGAMEFPAIESMNGFEIHILKVTGKHLAKLYFVHSTARVFRAANCSAGSLLTYSVCATPPRATV